MTEDKDLARAIEIISKWRIQKEEPFKFPSISQMIAAALKEERRRLLNDPRIKALVYEISAARNDLRNNNSGDETNMKILKTIKGFESLLKENEGKQVKIKTELA